MNIGDNVIRIVKMKLLREIQWVLNANDERRTVVLNMKDSERHLRRLGKRKKRCGKKIGLLGQVEQRMLICFAHMVRMDER